MKMLRRALNMVFACIIALTVAGCSAQANPQQFVGQFQGPCATETYYWQPVWSPDGTKLAFYSDSSESKLYVITPEGRIVFVSPELERAGRIDRPAWSPDGTQLAVMWHHRLAVINSDGTGLLQLVNNEEYDLSPTWSPDGTQILFVSNGNSLESINTDGTGRLQFSSRLNMYSAGEWSPDGEQILFEMFDSSNQTVLAVIDRRGSNLRTILVNPGGGFGGASWAPDGKHIAFGLGGDIYLIDNNSLNITQLTHFSGELHKAYSPSWSPDGKQIAFWDVLGPSIYVMNADGTDRIKVSHGWPGSFSWSPDGMRIAYISGIESQDIFVVNSDGTYNTQLTHNPANQTCFRWPF